MELLLLLAKLDCLLLFLSLLFNSSGALLSQDLGSCDCLLFTIKLPHDSYYVRGSLTKIGWSKGILWVFFLFTWLSLSNSLIVLVMLKTWMKCIICVWRVVFSLPLRVQQC
jgi:hypothetical protein